VIAPKRFWSDVTVVSEAGGGYGVRLDSRRLRTPAQAPLVLPTRALAEAVAAEWRDVAGEVNPETLPFTRLSNAAIDRVPPARDAVVDAIALYGETDLLCYRASEPAALRLLQDEAWTPPLEWAAAALGAPLVLAEGVVHQPQPPSSLAALRAAVASRSDFQLMALGDLVTLSGSLVLGLGVAEGAIAPEAAWALSRLDETWQAEQWGDDEDAAKVASDRRTAFLRAARMLEMLA
jgi:chaperone required for assembly of F1-ATPase